MSKKEHFDCECDGLATLVNLNEDYDVFCSRFNLLEQEEKVKLYQCDTCKQYWRIDVPGFRNVAYALKIKQRANWQQFDAAEIIKAHMLKSRGGFAQRICRKENCGEHVLNGSTYCLEHLYQSGARM